jgi:alpha-tubulin suppressor-like RCC1 family protein
LVFFYKTQKNTTINNTESGKLFTWGNNEYGQLGNGNTSNSSSPCLVDLKTPQTIIQCGGNHTVSLSSIKHFTLFFIIFLLQKMEVCGVGERMILVVLGMERLIQ